MQNVATNDPKRDVAVDLLGFYLNANFFKRLKSIFEQTNCMLRPYSDLIKYSD